MSKARIWNVVQEATHDEGNDSTRISFDNEEAANDFVEAAHRLEYESYIKERKNWVQDRHHDGWTKHDNGYLFRVVEGRELRAYPPPKPVDYEKWLAGKYTPLLDRGSVTKHVFDAMHEPTPFRVEEDWLYSKVPALVSLSGWVRTEDEFTQHNTMMEEILATKQ